MSTMAVVGGANGERFLRSESEQVELGRKYSGAPVPILPGGSGVNFACRLLAAGVDVRPVLPIADDAVGRVIEASLSEAARSGRARVALTELRLDAPGVSTPDSTILLSSQQRTVFNEFAPATLSAFARACDVRLRAILKETPGPDALIIGHIHSDQIPSAGAPGEGGRLTRELICAARAAAIPVFFNPGRAQYEQGAAAWEAVLPLVDCLQLDVHEMRTFAAGLGIRRLGDALDWFGERCTTVITMERAGAVARLRASDSIIASWPFQLSSRDIVDPTGAGDACMAGIACSALDRPLCTDLALKRAVETGMLWAAFACRHTGGATACPTRAQLREFQARSPDLYHTELRSLDEARPLLRLFDRVFP
jgi:sugar/nucleoside kinase (ribokinase family)